MRKRLAYNDKTNTHASRIYNQVKHTNIDTYTQNMEEKFIHILSNINKYYHKFRFPRKETQSIRKSITISWIVSEKNDGVKMYLFVTFKYLFDNR